jgi:methyltransferase (TIGR00027 family)
MKPMEPLIQHISDTALLAAVYRARESERPDALFHDPFARQLAGSRGEQIAAGLPFSNRHTWSWVTRTYLFDQFLAAQIEQGIDLVLNLAAGLDARPYRLALPPALQWMEVDLPGIITYKEELLLGQRPGCIVDRRALDLADVPARRELFQELSGKANRVLILSEGLLVYLTAEQVAGLAQDLAGAAHFDRWLLDLASPGLLRMLQKNMGSLTQGGASLKFAPAEGTDFFARHGWNRIEVRGLLKTAGSLGRLSLWLRLLSLLPEPKGRPGSRPWSGVCLFGKS